MSNTIRDIMKLTDDENNLFRKYNINLTEAIQILPSFLLRYDLFKDLKRVIDDKKAINSKK